MLHIQIQTWIKKISFALGLSCVMMCCVASLAHAATRTWDGGGGDNNWSTCANWDGPDTCPVAGDAVVFNGTSTKSSTIDAGFAGTITSISINSGYTGTITQATPLTVSSTFTTSAGTYSAAGQTLSVGSTFTMNTGSTFTASSGTTTFSGAFTINGGTFNNNSGTVTFNAGAGVTLSCNSISFNLVTFNNAGSTLVSSNCTMPLGANPTLAGVGTVTQAGTFSGSGTLTKTSGTLTVNGSNSTFTGFTAMSVSSLLFNGISPNLNLSSYTSFTSSGTVTAGVGTFTLSNTANSLATLTVSGGTVTQSSGTFTDSATVGMSSGSLTLANGAALNNSLTISGGTFNAPSGTMTIAGALTISGSPTFNADSGTIDFSGTTATLSCNSVTFNAVNFTGQTGAKTVNSNCSLPLGASPTIPTSITLAGTLSGSGTLTSSAGTMILNSGASLSGFSGISGVSLTVSGATTDLSGYSSFSSSNTVTVSSGSLSLPSGATLTILTISGGTFTAPSGTMSLSGALTISGSPTFNANSGTFKITGGTATLACNNVTFSTVSLAPTSGTKTINSTCSFPLGANPTSIAAAITLNGTLSGTGTLSFTNSLGTLTLNSGSSLSGFTGYSGNVLTVAGATADFSAYSSFSSSNTTTVSSGSLSLPSGVTLTALTISGGTFTAPSGTLTMSGALTISGSPTFNANSGTFDFSGSGGTLACNNVTFNAVNFTGQTGTKTVNSTCSLPLGANPTIPTTITLNGTLTGSGTLTLTAGTLTLNTGASLSGFTGLTPFALTIAGATADFSGYSSFTSNSSININTGSLSLPNGATVNGLFENGGTFNEPAGILNSRQAFVYNAGTYNNNNGTLNVEAEIPLNSNFFIINCNNTPIFHLVTVNDDPTGSSGKLVRNCVLPLGNNPTLVGYFVAWMNSTFTGTGLLTASYLEIDADSGLSGFSGLNTQNLYLYGDDNTIDLSSYNPVTIGFMDNADANFIAPTGTMTINGMDSNYSIGTFNANGGTVVFKQGSNHILDGNITFNNLTAITSSGDSILFTPNYTYTVKNNLILQGTNNTLLGLQNSQNNGQQWSINAQGTRLLQNLSVRDSNNVSGSPMITTGSTDRGNNTGWVFSANPISFNLDSPNDKAYISNERPTFRWKAATDANGSISNYSLQINNGDSGSWQINGIPASGTADYVTSKYRVHYENFNDSDPTNNYIDVTTQSSSDWTSTENDGQIKEGAHTWSVTANDNLGYSLNNSRTMFGDFTGPTVTLTQINSAAAQAGQTNTYTTANLKPTLFGKITDPLRGDNSTDGVSSGPGSVDVDIKKLSLLGLYDDYAQATVNITQSFWAADNTQITDNTLNTSDKYSPFSFTPDTNLAAGKYQITLTGRDNDGTSGSDFTFYLNVGNTSASAISNAVENIGSTANVISQALTPPATSPTSTPNTNQTPTVALKPIFDKNPPHFTLPHFLTSLFSQLNNCFTQLAEIFPIHFKDKFESFLAQLINQPTEISEVKVKITSPTSAQISWITNQPATGKVNYGLDETYPLETQSIQKTKNHFFTLTNLNPGTEYSFEVMSQGKTYVYDANRKFKTPAK